jgi:hypothetical protein
VNDVSVIAIVALGKPIKVEDMRTEPTLRFGTSANHRLDAGLEVIQSLDVDFPAEALDARRLKEIRLELAYIASPFHEETVNSLVSVGRQ